MVLDRKDWCYIHDRELVDGMCDYYGDGFNPSRSAADRLGSKKAHMIRSASTDDTNQGGM